MELYGRFRNFLPPSSASIIATMT